MAYTTVPDRAIGYALAETDWDVSIKDNLNSGAWVVLGSTKLAVDTASFDFTSISGSFAHLRLVAQVRGTAAGPSMLLRFNNDSGANYDFQKIYGNAGTPVASEFFGTTSIAPDAPASSTSLAGSFTTVTFILPHYANSANHKAVAQVSTTKFANASGNLYYTSAAGFWRSTAAINRVTLLPSSGNWAAGSAAALIGLP